MRNRTRVTANRTGRIASRRRKSKPQEKLERQQELYDDGREDLDDDKYQQAEQKFNELLSLVGRKPMQRCTGKRMRKTGKARKIRRWQRSLIWKRRYEQSKMEKKDAEALEIEVRQSTGHPVNPESQSDEELKTLALQGLMNSDPQRGVQMIEKRLAGTASPKDKAKMLFVLAQNARRKRVRSW